MADLALSCYRVDCLRFDALAWSKALKYSCNSCRACSEIAFGFDPLVFEARELRDDDGVRERPVPCEAGRVSFGDVRMKYDDCGLRSWPAVGCVYVRVQSSDLESDVMI